MIGKFRGLVVLWSFRHRGESRRFRESQLRRALAEVMTRCFLDAVPTVRKADLIEIGLEDLLLVVVLLHFGRGSLFAKLARKTHVTTIDDVGMHVADELLSDRARSTALLAEYSAFDRAGDADYVDAVVLIKALIFNSDERLRNVSR